MHEGTFEKISADFCQLPAARFLQIERNIYTFPKDEYQKDSFRSASVIAFSFFGEGETMSRWEGRGSPRDMCFPHCNMTHQSSKLANN